MLLLCEIVQSNDVYVLRTSGSHWVQFGVRVVVKHKIYQCLCVFSAAGIIRFVSY